MPAVALSSESLEAVVAARQSAHDRGDAEEFYRLRARETRLRAEGGGGVRRLRETSVVEEPTPPAPVDRRQELIERGLSEEAAEALAEAEAEKVKTPGKLPEMKKCPHCSWRNPVSASKCKHCGKSLSSDDGKDAEEAVEHTLEEKALSTKEREAIPKGQFVFPDKAPGSGSYPIHDIAHARNALARASGKPEEAQVRAKVYARYPQLKKSAQEAHFNPDAHLGTNPLRELRDAVAELEEGQLLTMPGGVSIQRGSVDFKVESDSIPGDDGHIIQAQTAEHAAYHALPICNRRRGARR